MATTGKQQPKQQRDEPPSDPGDSAALAQLELLGGRVCLDFINSVDPRIGGQQHDYLASYADLAQWSAYAHLLTTGQLAALLRAAEQHPRQADAVFARAIALRETLYRVFTALATRLPPAAADLAAVQSAYLDTMAQSHLLPTPDGYQWRWSEESHALDQMLWPIITSAVDLLTSPEARRVKVCPGLGDCGWLFLDISKSGRRRWCSMDSCGSRSKMRRYYARTHTPTPE